MKRLTFLLYFPLFTGFNNHSVDEGVFPEYTEMVEIKTLGSHLVPLKNPKNDQGELTTPEIRTLILN